MSITNKRSIDGIDILPECEDSAGMENGDGSAKYAKILNMRYWSHYLTWHHLYTRITTHLRGRP